MRLDLFQDGRLIASIEPIGNVGSEDFAFLPKRLVAGAMLNAESFDNLFFECLKDKRTHEQAYTQAEQIHEQYFGSNRYSGYESFANAKSQRLKK